ncbi:MAG: tRNA ((6))-methyltransferase TrmN6 [Labilithrix sp.]|nr:tRNA ((6))-methyltransferase TrmN6 [Labilithrix sp.]
MIPDPFETRRAALEQELGEPITLDGLTARHRIFQRKKGHRHSTDDLLTAWYALAQSPPARRFLDLGTGIGTVGLLVLAGMPEDAHLTCVEAQEVSFRFLGENVRANDLASRVTMLHGDLRELALTERFPLVTGSPPYFDVSTGIVPSDSQKAHARFELRGDVRDYAKAAARHLEPGGLFVLCFPFPQKQRALAALRAEGFLAIRHRDVVPREGVPPLFSLFACRLATTPDDVPEPAFVVRHADGRHTQAMHDVRARFGWPPSTEGTLP